MRKEKHKWRAFLRPGFHCCGYDVIGWCNPRTAAPHTSIHWVHGNRHHARHVSLVSLPCNWYWKTLTANHITSALACTSWPFCSHFASTGNGSAHMQILAGSGSPPPSVQEWHVHLYQNLLMKPAAVHVRNCHHMICRLCDEQDQMHLFFHCPFKVTWHSLKIYTFKNYIVGCG